jgi:RimJ/RimL family protein N-acetyltransferase
MTKDGLEILIREPKEGDERELMRFINSFIDEPRSGLLINKKITLDDEREWLRSRLSDMSSGKAVDLIMEHEGRIIGNCDVNRLPWKHSHRGAMGVAIAKDFRGRGLGEVLMRKTMELAVRRIKGLETIELSAFAYNDRALSLYRRLGFVEIGRIPRSAKEGEDYHDEVLMMMPLD